MPHPASPSLLLDAMGRLFGTTVAGASSLLLLPFPRLPADPTSPPAPTDTETDKSDPASPSDPPQTALYSARVCAAARALEAERPDALVRDPFAALLAGPDALAAARRRHAGAGGVAAVPRIAIRTRLFDDWIAAAVTPQSDASASAPAPAQLVLLAAGLDMRASRMACLRDTRVFEVDLPPVLAAKAGALRDARVCPRVVAAALARVPVDVTGDWSLALLAAGFDARAATVWVAEGLVYYLEAAQVEQLVARVRGLSGPRSRLFLSAVTGLSSPAERAARPGRTGLNAAFRSAMPEPCATLGALGFDVRRVVALGEPGARFGRVAGSDAREAGEWRRRRATIYVDAAVGDYCGRKHR